MKSVIFSLFVAGVAASSTSFRKASTEPKAATKLAHEMTHDLEMNFNKIAPFGQEAEENAQPECEPHLGWFLRRSLAGDSGGWIGRSDRLVCRATARVVHSRGSPNREL